MKYYIYFIAIIILNSCSNSEIEYYQNGTVKSEVIYRNGKKNGKAVYYYNNGQVNIECSYKADLLDGKYTKMNADRTLNEVSLYKNGMKNGLSVLYYGLNKKASEINYTDDIPNGDFFEYFENGRLKIKGRYVSGKYDGHWDYFDFNGIKVGEADFVKGNGSQKAFRYGGSTVKTVVDFMNNEKIREIHFEVNGDTSMIVVFSRGKVIDVKKFD